MPSCSHFPTMAEEEVTAVVADNGSGTSTLNLLAMMLPALDAVLVDQCFPQCLVARRAKARAREERKRKRKRKRGERREKREKKREERREEEGTKERRQREREGKTKRKGEREKTPPVCRFNTPPCVGSGRLRVYRQQARMSNTCGPVAGTHGDVLTLHTEAC